MAEDSSEKGMTRREFLKKGAASAVGLTIGGSAAIVAPYFRKNKPPKTLAAKEVATTPTAVPIQTPAPSPAETPVKKQEIESKEKFILDFFGKENFEKAREMVDKQIIHYAQTLDLNLPLRDGLRPRVLNTQKQQKEIVENVLNELKLLKDSFIRKMLPALIFVESEGNPNAQSSDKAKGLCQIKDKTAMEIVKNLGEEARELKLSNPPNLFDRRTNIIVAIKHLERLLRLFPEQSLAFWAYHLGEGNMTTAIEAFLRPQNPNVTRILNDKNLLGSAELVQKYHLDFIKLVNSSTVRQKLLAENAFEDDTEHYVPRLAAAKIILNHFSS